MRLYNSLSRREEELPPPPGPIRIYVCGSTVYQRVHVGNARPYVLGLWLKRWLEHEGYGVKLVENITDVDDKVYEEAARQGIGSRELAERATAWFREDTDDLGLGRPDVEPRASETMHDIVLLIEELIDRGLAYQADGDVYFRVARYPDYGRLSGAQLEEMVAQEPSALKEDQRDFALWKAQKPHEDAAWQSPWGPGRPGWHIECSAMAEKHLGRVFEIHGGGNDLRFPHHENELAQSRGAGREFARIWMHNGMLELDEAKMSKSLGNVVTLRNVIDTWGREALLVYLLSGHWRKPITFADETMEQAQAQWHDFTAALYDPPPRASAPPWEAFAAALDDDFNTPQALVVLHEWKAAGQLELLSEGLAVFGLRLALEPPPEDVQSLVRERDEARRRKDFGESDRLRDEIAGRGWLVRDRPDGSVVVPK